MRNYKRVKTPLSQETPNADGEFYQELNQSQLISGSVRKHRNEKKWGKVRKEFEKRSVALACSSGWG